MSAFGYLTKACRSENLEEECFASLATVLLVPDHTVIELPNFGTPLALALTTDVPDDCYTALLDCLDSCITLSCSVGGIESLLCSSFFDASVPCNLVGAHLLGVSRALDSLQDNQHLFTVLVAQQNPMLSAVWQAAISSGLSSRILESSLSGLPSINLAVASWTDTIQSFLQVNYETDTDMADYLPRAYEFSCAYMVDPCITKPFTPSPPFGENAVSNTSLTVRAHLAHGHRPVSHRTYWLLADGGHILAQPCTSFAPRPKIRLLHADQPTIADGAFSK